MKVTIIDKPNDVAVWISLTDEHDPRTVHESFVIGGGETREEAVSEAIEELEAAKRELLDAARENPRQKGDDDGREYAHPGDYLKGYED